MKGPVPRFTKVHVWKIIYEIFKAGRIGRQKLAKKVGVGEGTLRTILAFLKARNFIIIKQTGISLTEKAVSFLDKCGLQIAKLQTPEITAGKHNCALRVRNVAHKIRLGIEQRDEAIKAGASGATTLIYKNNLLSFPGEAQSLKHTHPKISAIIISKFKLENNDVIIIGFGNTLKSAEEGALAAALGLIQVKF
ncbi:MAG: DUF4443 domain-containing protein [Thermoplasmatales archaeon]|nr:DUF4443 domain-containing protein [Thermoplasmatales archaeon]